MSDKIKINLQIAGIPFPATILRDDEEAVREAAKQVNARVEAYRKHYADSVSTEKILAMTAFQFSLDSIRLRQRNDTDPYDKRIKELNSMLEDYFKA